MTDYRDSLVMFKNLSTAEYHNLSITSSAGQQLWNGFSLTRNFQPLRSFNPATADPTVVASVVATMLMDLMSQR